MNEESSSEIEFYSNDEREKKNEIKIKKINESRIEEEKQIFD